MRLRSGTSKSPRTLSSPDLSFGVLLRFGRVERDRHSDLFRSLFKVEVASVVEAQPVTCIASIVYYLEIIISFL